MRTLVKSQGRLHERFLILIAKLIEWEKKSYESELFGATRLWYLPDDGERWQGDVLDIENMDEPFSRREIATSYAHILGDTPPGSTGDLMATKIQSEYIAALERAFRTRHATSVRSRIHSTVRQEGHAHSKGVFSGQILDYVDTLLAKGRGEEEGL